MWNCGVVGVTNCVFREGSYVAWGNQQLSTQESWYRNLQDREVIGAKLIGLVCDIHYPIPYSHCFWPVQSDYAARFPTFSRLYIYIAFRGAVTEHGHLLWLILVILLAGPIYMLILSSIQATPKKAPG